MIPTIAIIMRKDRADPAGRCPILLRITVDRKSTYKSTGFRIDPQHWDGSQVSKKVSNHDLINTSLARMMADAQKMILERRITTGKMSTAQIRAELRDEVGQDFYKYADKVISGMQHIHKHSTIRQYISELKKMQEYQPGSILISSITVAWLDGYNQWLAERGDLINTRWKAFKFIRKIFNHAITAGITREYPFRHFKARYKQGLRSFLSSAQLQELWQAVQKEQEPTVRLSGLYFLLSCYTGLRVSDLRRVPQGELRIGSRLILATHKSGEIVSIKIIKPIQDLLEAIRDQPMPAEQTLNKYIKILAFKAEISTTRRISMHMARHTFAVRCADLGIPKEVVQKLLGHKDIKTTEIYYKITDRVLDQALEKME
jgi:integrase/recombinase XerD